MAAHFQNDRWQGKYEAYPETPGHVRKLRVGRGIKGSHRGLQRHAADRTATGTDLPHLRVHRTGIDGAGRCRGFGLFRLQEFFRLGFETFAAARRAEEIVLSVVSEPMLGGCGIDAHAANRIDRSR